MRGLTKVLLQIRSFKKSRHNTDLFDYETLNKQFIKQ